MAFGLTPVAPAYAVPPAGEYELRGQRCIGVINDECHPTSRPLLIQLETNQRALLKEIEVPYDRTYRRYEFALDLDGSATPRDLLRERVCLYATNAFGLRSKLALDGASQLSLIREHLGKPRVVLFDLDLTRGGNGIEFMREGWNGPELQVCCSEGSRSVIEVPVAASPADRHELTMECFPFLAPPSIDEQRMTVRVNGFPQEASHDGKMLDFFSFIIPANVMDTRDTTLIEFDFPNCYAPIDLNVNKDVRRLAFGFKQVVLARLLPVGLEG